jgi:hypothetical protein
MAGWKASAGRDLPRRARSSRAPLLEAGRAPWVREPAVHLPGDIAAATSNVPTMSSFTASLPFGQTVGGAAYRFRRA